MDSKATNSEMSSRGEYGICETLVTFQGLLHFTELSLNGVSSSANLANYIQANVLEKTKNY